LDISIEKLPENREETFYQKLKLKKLKLKAEMINESVSEFKRKIFLQWAIFLICSDADKQRGSEGR
jgi:hypothetical protein